MYLTNELKKTSKSKDLYEKLLINIKSHSIISWGHINMLGEYDFSEKKLEDSMGLKLIKNII